MKKTIAFLAFIHTYTLFISTSNVCHCKQNNMSTATPYDPHLAHCSLNLILISDEAWILLFLSISLPSFSLSLTFSFFLHFTSVCLFLCFFRNQPDYKIFFFQIFLFITSFLFILLHYHRFSFSFLFLTLFLFLQYFWDLGSCHRVRLQWNQPMNSLLWLCVRLDKDH